MVRQTLSRRTILIGMGTTATGSCKAGEGMDSDFHKEQNGVHWWKVTKRKHTR